MKPFVVVLSLPGLREGDLASMPRLSSLAEGGVTLPLKPVFPAVTLPVQVSMMTGRLPQEHGVIANGFYWRDRDEVEMWTAWNDVVTAPQIWDLLHQHDADLTSAAWFPMWAKGAGADYICVPAPRHNPDGTESLWCYTRPDNLYEEMLLKRFGHFPLMNFWGPLSSIASTKWIADSAVAVAEEYRPKFSYIYLPHLDYAAQKFGPDSPQALQALAELDEVIGRLSDGLQEAGLNDILWLAAGEYVITPVDGAVFPNRLLREAGYLQWSTAEDGTELLQPGKSRAWALVDHQCAHVFVREESDVDAVAALFRDNEDIAEVLTGAERSRFGIHHPRSGEVVLIARPEKWFAYYWWLDDACAPAFARTVDIHRKPGYDPVELFIDMETKSTPLDAGLVRGSHGCPADSSQRQTVLLCSDTSVLSPGTAKLQQTDIAPLVLRNFGIEFPSA